MYTHFRLETRKQFVNLGKYQWSNRNNALTYARDYGTGAGGDSSLHLRVLLMVRPPTLEGIVNRSRGFMTGGLATERWKNGPRAEGVLVLGGCLTCPHPRTEWKNKV